MAAVEKIWMGGLDVNKPKDRNKFKKNYFTRCPLNDYARAHGYLEILPVMCELDFKLAGLYHATLYRKQTLASGGSICDYWYVQDQNPEYFGKGAWRKQVSENE